MNSSSLENFLKRKKEVKKSFSEKLSFSHKKPLLGIILDKELSSEDEVKLKHILEGTMSLNVQVLILADTNLDVISFAHTIIIPYSAASRKHVLEACDMALCFGFNDVEEMLLHGTIPISGARSEVEDYNPNRETGNGFIYKNTSHWGVFAALVRALETFKFPYDWNHIVRQGRQMALVSVKTVA